MGILMGLAFYLPLTFAPSDFDDRMEFEQPGREAQARAEKALQLFLFSVEHGHSLEKKRRWARLTADAYFDLSLRYADPIVEEMGAKLRSRLINFLLEQLQPEERRIIQNIVDLYREDPSPRRLRQLLEVLQEKTSPQTQEDLSLLEEAFVASFESVSEKDEFQRPAWWRSVLFGFFVPVSLEVFGRLSLALTKKIFKVSGKFTKSYGWTPPAEWKWVVQIKRSCRSMLYVFSQIKRPRWARVVINPITTRVGLMTLFGFLSYHYWFKSHQPWAGAERETQEEILPFLEFELRPVKTP